MRVLDEKLLDEYRGPGICEWCRKTFARLEPHHLYARGMGGGNRLDVRVNLIALCNTCHRSHHDGREPLRCDLLAMVAAREGLQQGQIQDIIWRLERASSKASPRDREALDAYLRDQGTRGGGRGGLPPGAAPAGRLAPAPRARPALRRPEDGVRF